MKDLTNYVGFFFKKGGESKKGSGIHIKKSHEGLFTKKAKAAGYGVQEYARHVLANKGSYDSATVKQAVFAKNAAGFKHQDGGTIDTQIEYGPTITELYPINKKVDGFFSGTGMRQLPKYVRQEIRERAKRIRNNPHPGNFWHGRYLSPYDGLTHYTPDAYTLVKDWEEYVREHNIPDISVKVPENPKPIGQLDLPYNLPIYRNFGIGGVIRPVLKGQLGLQVPGKYIDDVRLDFSRFIPDKVNGEERYVNPDNMSKIQDMLIEAGIPYTQRVAILSTILQESGGNPNATSKTGKYRGLLQWDSTRMPTVLSLEDQVKKIIDEINDTNAGQFTDGGSGGPYVATAKSGREQFMKSTDPYAATVLFNKTYVRPKKQQSWYNRANQAAAIHNILGSLNDQKQNESWSMPDWVYGMEQTGGYGYKSPEPVGQFGRGGRVVPMWKIGARTYKNVANKKPSIIATNDLQGNYRSINNKIDYINHVFDRLPSEDRNAVIDILRQNAGSDIMGLSKAIRAYNGTYSWATEVARKFLKAKNEIDAVSKYLNDNGISGVLNTPRLSTYANSNGEILLGLSSRDASRQGNEEYIGKVGMENVPYYIPSIYTTKQEPVVINTETKEGQETTDTDTAKGSTQTTETKDKSAQQTTVTRRTPAPYNPPQYVKDFWGPTTSVTLVNGAPVMSAPKQTVVPAVTQLSPEDIAYKDTLMRALNPQAFDRAGEVTETPTVALTRHKAKRTSNGKKVRVDGKRVQLAQSVGRGYQNMSRKGTENRDYIVWTNNEI